MSAEPKPEKTTLADLARALDPILYPHLNPLMQGWPRLMQIATQICVAFRAAGWIGPEEAAAREAAARREALLEGDARRRELSRNLERATQLCRKAQAEALAQVERVTRVEALALPDGIWKGDKHVRLTRRDRTLGCDITESYVRVDDLMAALAEPEHDEEPCSCGSRDATSLTPGEWLHHSPDGCTIERGGEGGR